MINGLPSPSQDIISEEILHTNYAHWWSPDGRMIAYIQFNDTLVPAFHFLVYGESNDLYGTVNELPYPKVRLLILCLAGYRLAIG